MVVVLRRWCSLLPWLILPGLLGGMLASCGEGGVQLRAGVSAVSISPQPEHLGEGVYLGGYGGFQSRMAEGVHDDIFSRALALSDGTDTVVLVALDLIGISNVQLGQIRAAAAARAGIPEGNILIASTHSHATPDLQGLWGGVGEAYREYLRERAVQSVAEAVSQLDDAELRAASVEAEGLTENRRGWGFTDNVLTVLQARRPGGEAIATLVNFAVHPTVTGPENLEVSGDFVGYLVEALETEFGGTALFINGDQGDSVPAESGDFAAARQYGERLTEVVVDALADAEGLEQPLRLESVAVEVPIEHPLFAQFAASGMLDYETVTRDGQPYVSSRVSILRIGGRFEAVALPGEALTRLGQTIRGQLSARHGMLFGLTDDTLGYFVPADEWETGRNEDYEESVCLSPRAAAVILEAVASMVEVTE
jgi:hypothetical protein